MIVIRPMFPLFKISASHRLYQLLPCLLVACTSVHAAVIYVDHDFDGVETTGQSWENPFPMLEQAVKAASTNGVAEIWVKAGLYQPYGFGRDATFELIPDLAVYGGFKGNETSRDQRDPVRNRTILSGDLGRSGSTSGNSFHVITGASGILLDGFIITRGQANAAAEQRFGGGIYFPAGATDAVLANCTFEKNYAEVGGAVYGQQSEIVITNCTFFSNSAKSGGAVATHDSSALRILDSTFSSNFSQDNGGAVHLEGANDALFKNSSFLYNSTYGHGGALAIYNEPNKQSEISVLNCTFNENSSSKSGGGLYLEGPFRPLIANCTFERNTAEEGSGAWANTGGVMALMTNTKFVLNLGSDDSKVIDNDATSYAARTQEELITAAKRIGENAVRQAAVEPPPEPAQKRELPDVRVFNETDTLISLKSLIETNHFTAIVLGDLTDPDFILHHRNIEATANNYRDHGVHFFYLYRYLSHPENNGYVQPFNIIERKRHTQLATEMLSTRIPWLHDQMDNQAAAALTSNRYNQVYIYDDSGMEVYAGNMSDGKMLTKTIEKLAGAVEAVPTQDVKPSVIEPFNPLDTKLVKRVEIDSKKDPFIPVQLTPLDSKYPYYVKARVEVSKELLKTGDGKLYLGFHIDPIYEREWNNLGEPLRYVLKTPAGVTAPSINSAPRITAQATDTEPREFLLEARKLDNTRSLALSVVYSVYSPRIKQNQEIEQRYLITLQEDLFAGAVFGRQKATQPKKTTAALSAAGTSAFANMLRRFDLDRNGKLTEDEVIGGLRANFAAIDTNNDGSIDEEEYAIYRQTQ